MSDWNEKLPKLTNDAISGNEAATVEHAKWLAARIVRDVEKADHEKVARILSDSLEAEAIEAAKRGETCVGCSYVLYEINKPDFNIIDYMGRWIQIIILKTRYAGLHAEGLYEGVFIGTYYKTKFAFNPKIYADRAAFEKLKALLIEELAPFLAEHLPENVQIDFPDSKDCKIEIIMRLDW